MQGRLWRGKSFTHKTRWQGEISAAVCVDLIQKLDNVKIERYNVDSVKFGREFMEKKSYHHKNLKNDLIEKGIELVDKYGINQLSLRKVAQACNVSHAAPYSHFSSNCLLYTSDAADE